MSFKLSCGWLFFKLFFPSLRSQSGAWRSFLMVYFSFGFTLLWGVIDGLFFQAPSLAVVTIFRFLFLEHPFAAFWHLRWEVKTFLLSSHFCNHNAKYICTHINEKYKQKHIFAKCDRGHDNSRTKKTHFICMNTWQGRHWQVLNWSSCLGYLHSWL